MPKKQALKPTEQTIDGRPRWDTSHGTYLTGRSYIDGADALAVDMERKWGCDRLRLLVDAGTREKFDRQRFLFSDAISNGDLEAVRLQSARMVAAWAALDKMASMMGRQPLPREVWEVVLADGTVAAVVPDSARAAMVIAEGRKVAVYTMGEIGKLLDAHHAVVAMKLKWPGASVTATRVEQVSDPLNAVRDGASLDDPVPDFSKRLN